MKAIITLLILFNIGYSATNKYNLITDDYFTNQDYTFCDVYKTCKKFSRNRFTSNQVDIIYKSAKKYKLNYKLVLVVLEKETGIVSNPPHVDAKYSYWNNICMGVALQKYAIVNGKKKYLYGTFNEQIENGCRVLRKWYDYYYPGIEKKIKNDNGYETIKPDNAGTYSLYMFTPHYYPTTKYGCISGGYAVLDILIKRME